MNYVLKNRERLKAFNYIRKADPAASYWFDFSEGPLAQYRENSPAGFNLVLAGSPDKETDFFVIPYELVEGLLVEENLVRDKNSRRRWIGNVRNNRLKITHHNISLDIGEGYGNVDLLENPQFVASLGSESSGYPGNDYAGYGRIREVEQRINQSRFRAAVLANFGSACCLNGVTETDLLIAGHIVPWADRVDCRLDPSNGLLFSPLYDRLFDKGYFSFDDSLRVVLSRSVISLSAPLQATLFELEGVRARQPLEYPIKAEYLAYHRQHVLRP